jgi:hypothetical protein
MPDAVELQSKKKIHPSRLKLVAHVVNDWSVVAEAGTPYEAVRDDPAYWAHIASKLRPGDIIHVRTDDSAYYARLYVRAAEKLAARVIELEFKDFSKLSAETLPAGNEFEVEWAGPHHKYRIVRTKDRVAVQTGFDNKERAIEAMVTHVKTMAA